MAWINIYPEDNDQCLDWRFFHLLVLQPSTAQQLVSLADVLDCLSLLQRINYIFFLIGSWTVGQSAVHKNSMTGFFICSVVCLQLNENWFHYLSVLKNTFCSSKISQAARDHLDWPWCIKWTDESFPRVDLLVGLICYDQSDLGSHPDHLNAMLLCSCRLITGV